MKKIIIGLPFLFLIISIANAQIPDNMNASEILLQMKKLRVLGSVLYIAAHPDDENTRLLAWLSKEKLYHTGYLSLTRGDGGQNLIGDEQGIELGLIRTQELLAARQVDGADQFFSRAYDFGFSKSTAEALKLWNEQKILSDVVWVIRKFQPDIVITRFPEDKRAGHGQHSASSVLAHMAFNAAADPKQFPEQFKYGVTPWKARRLFWNNYNFGNINTIKEDQLKIEVGGYNPLEGKSYGEIAADSRSQHRSQGFGVPHSRGNQLEYFTLTEGEMTDSSLMQRIDCTWNRISAGAPIGEMVEKMIKNYTPSAPYQSLKELVAIYKSIEALPEGYWRAEKLKETQDLIQACDGLYLEATVPGAYAVQDQSIPVTLQIVNRSPFPVTLNSVSLNGQDTSWNQVLNQGVNYSVVRNISLRNLPISQPYWLIEPMSPGSYNVPDQQQIGNPWNAASPEADFKINLAGEIFIFRQRIFYKSTDPAKGESYQPMTIIPGMMAYCIPDLLLFTKGKEQNLSIIMQQKATIPQVAENLSIRTSSTTQYRPATTLPDFSLTGVSEFKTRETPGYAWKKTISLMTDVSSDMNQTAWVINKDPANRDTMLQCRTISYEHIPRIDYFRQAKTTLVSVNLKSAGRRIGYIEGAGDKVPDALIAMGYSVIRLNENSITSTELEKLDAVITGLRAYEVQKWLPGKYSILMDYIYKGGNLIVQYNRNQGTDSAGIGPWNFGISNARVSEEDAPVGFLLPDHPVLHFPNEITTRDFDGWVQERGIYFAQHADPRYATVLTMHDTDEPAQNGSLIIANYGKGNFTYTGLVFFRELPAGVPGAYRLLANIIALNQHKDQ